MHLTKTDFLLYLQCQKSFWLYKNAPDEFPHGDFSLFMQKLIREGYEVERYVQQHFRKHLPDKNISFQTEFKTVNGLYARVDALEIDENGFTTLYEVKSSTSVKTDTKHNQLKDACFQKVCTERAGTEVHRVCIVHLNADYVRNGEIETEQLLKFEDITKNVAEIQTNVELEIDNALVLLKQDNLSFDGCECLDKTRANHCDTFSIFNPAIPTTSIYSLPRISAKTLAALRANGIINLDDVPDEFDLSESQRLVVESYKARAPQISSEAICKTLNDYQYPLYFFDFETYASSVPIVDGASPHKHFPVQYSLHILHETGELEHKEFLQRNPALPIILVEQMERDIGLTGSIVSWHASFEKTQNRSMADWFPDKAHFLTDLNNRMVDLEEIFKKDYVDAKFDGSTSIKKVLPIICPHLNYNNLEVQNGASAMDAWASMINASHEEADKIAADLLAYCSLDTLAMVEIYKFLRKQ